MPPNSAIARRHKTGNSGVRRARPLSGDDGFDQRRERHDLLVAFQPIVELSRRADKVV